MEEAEFIHGRRACPRLIHDGKIQHLSSPQQLHVPDILCSERYAAEVTCGNLTYLFTRHDLGDHKVSSSTHAWLPHRKRTLIECGYATASGLESCANVRLLLRRLRHL